MIIRISKNVLLFFAAFTACPLWANVKMPAVFSDNMVLQQGTPISVYGSADPQEKIVVQFLGQRKETVADSAGTWTVTLDSLQRSSTPAEMRVLGKNTVNIKNVLVGDVWLASGQSNMAFNVGSAQNASQEIRAANHPGIRFFMVETDLASSPKNDCAGKWLVCNPNNAGSFSAVAYYFARELHHKYEIPTGVINSAVGASSCQTWTPAEVLVADKSLPQLAPIAPENYRSLKDYSAFREKIYEQYSHKDPGIKPECLAWARPDFNASDWKGVVVPGSIESQGMKIDGAVWFRKEVDVPAAWAGSNLALSLGPINDEDIVYMNGTKVGATENHWRQWLFRSYTIPAKLVKAGKKNVIAVRIFNRINNGGFYPEYPDPMKLSKDAKNVIILTGKWKCKVELALNPASLPFTPPATTNVPTGFYNAMIAPFTKYPLRGFVWYQGEGNAGVAKQHDTLFPAMIESWRKHWSNEKLPFYFVQLANFMPRKPLPSESAWASLRESQLKTLSLHDTGIAVSIDVGEALDIHPKNKQDVGKRLARWAMRDCYGENIEPSGPLYASNTVENGKIKIRFTHIAGGLKVKGNELKGFAIAAADKKFVWAKAAIDGDGVVVWSPEVKSPRFVRYAWADNPECNLYNDADLPASPFRTDGDGK